jgi:hypothetical protein
VRQSFVDVSDSTTIHRKRYDMSEHDTAPSTFPADAGAETYLLTVRGKFAADSLATALQVHNATAGAPQSVAGARSLGDLSHNVFVPYGEHAPRELLFIDFWNSLTGLGQFFANPQVQASAAELFTERDGAAWSQAPGYGHFHLMVPAGKGVAGLGLMRVRVTSVQDASLAFRAYTAATLSKSRLYGIVAGTTWIKVPNPGEQPEPELISIDLWTEPDQMAAYYKLELGFDTIGPVFAGPPQTSAWQAAPGEWAEW